MLVMRLMVSLTFGPVVLGPVLNLASSSLVCFLSSSVCLMKSRLAWCASAEHLLKVSCCVFSLAVSDLTCMSKLLLVSISVCTCAAKLSTVAIA